MIFCAIGFGTLPLRFAATSAKWSVRVRVDSGEEAVRLFEWGKEMDEGRRKRVGNVRRSGKSKMSMRIRRGKTGMVLVLKSRGGERGKEEILRARMVSETYYWRMVG